MTSSDESTEADGGRTALGGFLYQIVGVLGLAAWADQPRPNPSRGDVEELLAVVGGSRIGHEVFGQDAALLQQLGVSGQDTCALIQFKYSAQSRPPALGKQEFLTILDRLRASTIQARQRGQQVTSYFLVTNRHLGPSAVTIRDTVLAGNADASLGGRDYSPIVQGLHVIGQVELARWDDALRTFAARHGVLGAEVRRGMDALTGSVLRRTTEDEHTWIERQDLVDAFTGSREARTLTYADVAPHSRERVNRFPTGLSSTEPVRRDLLARLGRLATTRALVVLHGQGGCGKTVTLRQWAYDLAFSPSDSGACTDIASANSVGSDWIAWLVAEWANLPADHPRRREGLEQALSRLEVANVGVGAAPPILHLAIDGLDDDVVARADVRRAIAPIVEWFQREDQRALQQELPPRATLVVTYRELDTFSQEWLWGHVYGDDELGGQLAALEAADFTVDELVEAAENGVRAGVLPEGVVARLRVTLQRAGPGPFGPSAAVTGSSDAPRLGTSLLGSRLIGSGTPAVGGMASSRGADNEIVLALVHPALWGTYHGLPQGMHLRVLDRDVEAVRHLCQSYVARFYSKAWRRGQHAGLNQRDCQAVLSRIAHQTDATTWTDRRGWIELARTTGATTDGQATILYNEAVSWGLVIKEGERWRWRHGFVRAYLAAIEGFE